MSKAEEVLDSLREWKVGDIAWFQSTSPSPTSPSRRCGAVCLTRHAPPSCWLVVQSQEDASIYMVALQSELRPINDTETGPLLYG